MENHVNSRAVYVPVQVCGVRSEFLMDTGAAVTVISKKRFFEIPRKQRPLIHKLDPVNLQTANGAPLKLYGVSQLKLKIGNKVYPWTVYVAEIAEDGYLGFDFLCKFNFTFSVSQGLTLGNNKVQTVHKAKRLSCELDKMNSSACVSSVSNGAKNIQSSVSTRVGVNAVRMNNRQSSSQSQATRVTHGQSNLVVPLPGPSPVPRLRFIILLKEGG